MYSRHALVNFSLFLTETAVEDHKRGPDTLPVQLWKGLHT